MVAGLVEVFVGFCCCLPTIILCCCICRLLEEDDNAAAERERAAARYALHALQVHPPAPVQVVERRVAAVPAPAVKMELGYFPYSAAVKDDARGASSMVCAICLEELVEGAMCSEVPACRHLFHRDCIQLWMKSKSTCPLCRVRIVPGSEPLSAAEDMV